MENVTFHGEFHHVDGIELDVVHGRREPRHVPIMIGATGAADDGADRRDRRRRGAQLLRAAGIQHRRRWSSWNAAPSGPGARSTTSTARSWSSARCMRTARRRWTAPRELLTQYLAQQPHIAKASGVKPEVVQQIQSILGWPATKEQVRAGHAVLCPTNWCSASPPAARPPRSRPKCASIWQMRLHLPDPLSAGRCQDDDRYLCRWVLARSWSKTAICIRRQRNSNQDTRVRSSFCSSHSFRVQNAVLICFRGQIVVCLIVS